MPDNNHTPQLLFAAHDLRPQHKQLISPEGIIIDRPSSPTAAKECRNEDCAKLSEGHSSLSLFLYQHPPRFTGRDGVRVTDIRWIRQ